MNISFLNGDVKNTRPSDKDIGDKDILMTKILVIYIHHVTYITNRLLLAFSSIHFVD